MAKFNYRTSASAPWQELSMIGDIITGGSGAHEVVTISQAANNGSTLDWANWADYITNFDDVEALIIAKDYAAYVYIKGVLPGINSNGYLPYYVMNRNSSGNYFQTGTEDITKYHLAFVENGMKIRFNGNYLSCGKIAVFLVLRKGAA